MKKKILSLSLIAMVGLGIVATPSCKKYPEGPSLSIKSKKARLAGTWKESKVIKENGDAGTPDNTYTLTFTKDGKVTVKTDAGMLGTLSVDGTWKFDNKKENIITTYGNSTSQRKIIELKNKELGLEDPNGYKTYYTKQ